MVDLILFAMQLAQASSKISGKASNSLKELILSALSIESPKHEAKPPKEPFARSLPEYTNLSPNV